MGDIYYGLELRKPNSNFIDLFKFKLILKH